MADLDHDMWTALVALLLMVGECCAYLSARPEQAGALGSVV